MEFLHSDRLDQISSDIEVLDHILDRKLFESINLENIEFNDFATIDTDKYGLYQESFVDIMNSVAKRLVQLIKLIFTKSGKKMTIKEAKSIVHNFQNRANISSEKWKELTQKAFYIIAGLGRSINGKELLAAYNSGDIIAFVSKNISKIDFGSLPDSTTFRICIGYYPKNVKVSMNILTKVFEVLSTKGIEGINQLGRKNKMNESFEDDELLLEAGKLKDLIHEFADDAKYAGKQIKGAIADPKKGKRLARQLGKDAKDAVQQVSTPEKREQVAKDFKQDAQHAATEIRDVADDTVEEVKDTATEVVRDVKSTVHNAADKFASTTSQAIENVDKTIGAAKAGATVAVTIGGTVLVIKGICALVDIIDNSPSKIPTTDDHVDMITITYMDENKSSAKAKIRVYSKKTVKSYNIIGQDKISSLRDDLIDIAENIRTNSGRLSLKEQQKIKKFSDTIITAFSALSEDKMRSVET